MSVVLYVALVTGDIARGYAATFPDLPDLQVSGADLGELLTSARQVLTAHLECLENAGDAWPAATPIEALAVPAGAITIPVDVAVDDPPIRVNVSLGERLVQRLDAAAESRGMTRSGFIAQSVRASLGESARPAGVSEDVGRRLQDEIVAIGRKLNDSLGPDSAFTKRMNAFDDVVYEGVRKAADSLSAAIARRNTTPAPTASDARD
ncbi:MAG: type II toxin-antitoxin system HicB family antitoxin [Alphaproteobacteria bacterium]|nr:type II toxin-antitoxin system HicB family antitoxin [Alphaproteobacteria bacterium]MBU1514551.1 type II toxin-antitoxin system HicB family antitoxin [Alphaproteobacteria bacterium]MBU2096817.1 type II toxin-antitoxin system HicB family antitoxin [Alphaproteobacteria bacterium]MBU2153444.1 type II toxin-antitoxin system HicB family antitoxin [Alphaproteobacteria bacterium]MBU2306051.1 type II toxin-antitoxin system HicB family antitoxin [Alphaproteobacteria bacterium]